MRAPVLPGPGAGPVGSWLSELRGVHEAECTIMLQSKPVRRAEAEAGQEAVGEVRERIRLIQDRAHTLSSTFASMCRWGKYLNTNVENIYNTFGFGLCNRCRNTYALEMNQLWTV